MRALPLALFASLLAPRRPVRAGVTERIDPPPDGAEITGLGSDLAGRFVAFSKSATKTAGKLASRLRSRAARKIIPADRLLAVQNAASKLKQDLVTLRRSL